MYVPLNNTSSRCKISTFSFLDFSNGTCKCRYVDVDMYILNHLYSLPNTRVPERLMAFEMDYRFNRSMLRWIWRMYYPHLIYILYHWAGLVVGVMCLACLTVQDRPGPGFPSSSSSRISEQRVRAESVSGRGRGCVLGWANSSVVRQTQAHTQLWASETCQWQKTARMIWYMITSFSLHRDRMIELSLMSYINIKHWSSDLRIRTYRYYGIVGLFQNFRYHLLKGLMVYRINRIERSEKQFCGEHVSVSDLLVSTWQGPGVRTSVMWAELCWQGQCQESGH